MFKRALVFRRQARSLGAAFVLTVVLTLVMTIATPGSAAHAEEPVAPAPGEAAVAASVEPHPAPPVEAPPVEPAPVEPAPAEPAPVEPAPVEPVPVPSAPSEPAPIESAPAEPAPVAPVPPQPAPTEPAPVGPALPEPAPVEPELTDPEHADGDAAVIEPAAVLASPVQITCQTSQAYSVGPNGAVHLIHGDSKKLSAAQQLPAVATWTNVDGLGVSASAGTMHAFRSSANGMSTLLTLTSGTDAWQETAAPITTHDRPLVAGAISLADGRYYVGGFTNQANRLVFRVYRISPTGGVTSIGWFDAGSTTPAGDAVNGDMAFDASGNLYVIRGNSSATRYTVTAAALAAGAGGGLARTLLDQQQGGSQPAGTGLAFTSGGFALVSNDTHARYINPVTWKSEPGNTNLEIPVSDLAGCASPTTVTLRKNVVARADGDDQFELRMQIGGAERGPVVTADDATGVQLQQIGPIAVVADSTVSFQESVVNGRAGDYTSNWSCTNGAAGAGTAASTVAIAGGSVVCTFRNAPRTNTTTVTVIKTVVDASGGNPQRAAGWQLDATASGTGVTTAPVDSAAAGTADASGSAGWIVRYAPGATAASIIVSETQRPGYEWVSLTCTVVAPDGSSAITRLGGVSGVLSNVAAGSDVSCEFVNLMLPTTLSLAVVVDGNEPAASWPVSADAPDGAAQGPSGNGAASGPVAAGATYDLTLGEGSPYYVQDGEWTCSVAGAPVTLTEGAITLALGDAAACSVTVATARLILLKQIDGVSALHPEQFTLTATPDSVAELGLSTISTTGTADEATATEFEVRPDTAYALGEQSQFAYLGLAIEQRHAETGEWSAVTDPSALVLEPGERAVIRFISAAPPALTLPLTGGVGADTYLIGGLAVLLLALALLAGFRMRDVRRRGRLT